MRRCRRTRGCIQQGGHRGPCQNSKGFVIPGNKPVEVRVVGARSRKTGKPLFFRIFYVFSTGKKKK